MKPVVRTFLITWAIAFGYIAGFVGGLATMIWTMTIADEHFGAIGWASVLIFWIATLIAAAITIHQYENDQCGIM
ncbi:hypothetical protein D3C80_1675250 [compost metagenome]